MGVCVCVCVCDCVCVTVCLYVCLRMRTQVSEGWLRSSLHVVYAGVKG